MSRSSLTKKGQTTVPKEIRNHLNLKAGDLVEFIITSSGEVLVKPAVLDVGELKGLLKDQVKRPVSIEEMRSSVLTRAKQQI